MKNRNFVFIAIVLVSVICLGVIGYAGYTDDLSVKGNVSINNAAGNDAFDKNIHFSAELTDISVKASTATDDDSEKVLSDKTATADEDKVTVTVQAQENGDVNDLINIKVDAGLLNFEDDSVTVIAKIVNDNADFDAVVSAAQYSVTGDAGFTTDTIAFCDTVNGEYKAESITLEAKSAAYVKIVISLDHNVTGDETYTVGDFTFALSAGYTTPTVE